MATATECGMTECGICAHVYTDPRVLPCGHTFCFKCLEKYSKNKRPGVEMPCPMCRTQFSLPRRGVGGLPKNFVVADIVQFSVETSYCEQHQDKCIELYCRDCETAICALCCIKTHNGHECADVKEVEDEFRKQMTTDAGNMTAGVDKCRELLQRVEKEKHDITEQVRKVEMEIDRKVQHLQQMKQKKIEIENVREEIETRLVSVESFKNHVDEVRQKGTVRDIARAASGLHNRADELLKFDVIERMLADLGHANYMITEDNETLGQLRPAAMKSKVPTLSYVIPSQDKGKVFAVTSLGDDVFVMRGDRQQIEVYDADTFKLQRRITLRKLGPNPRSLAVCAVNRCIYVSDWNNDSIHRVELAGRYAVKTWSVASRPTGLSVNKAHNLVVACLKANKLQEYTTDGSLVREIRLQAGVTSPWHAIQLSTGHYVVSQYKSPGVVRVVGVDGQVIHSYGQSQTSDVGEMKYPSSLAVTKNDDILVTDEINNRILSIISSTGRVQELALSVDGGIHWRCGMCLDESRGRLYVGEYTGQHRVLVFDGVSLSLLR